MHAQRQQHLELHSSNSATLVLGHFYPFARCVTDLPQRVLGFALSAGVPVRCELQGVISTLLVKEHPSTAVALAFLCLSYLIWTVICDIVYGFREEGARKDAKDFVSLAELRVPLLFPPDADVYPPVFQGKARLVNISPTKKKSVSAPPPRSKIATIPKRFPSGTSLSDVTEEDYDPSMLKGPADSAPKTLPSKCSDSSIYASYGVSPPGLINRASAETVGLDTAAQDEDDLTIRAPTTPTHAVSPAKLTPPT